MNVQQLLMIIDNTNFTKGKSNIIISNKESEYYMFKKEYTYEELKVSDHKYNVITRVELFDENVNIYINYLKNDEDGNPSLGSFMEVLGTIREVPISRRYFCGIELSGSGYVEKNDKWIQKLDKKIRCIYMNAFDNFFVILE